jgi:hypothetical protein
MLQILSSVLSCVFMKLRLLFSHRQDTIWEQGRKTSVLIDLKRHGQLWEDFYDSVIARNRVREPRESLDAVKDRLRRLGKLRG